MDIEEIRADIAAFADREEDVIIDKGLVVFERDRQTVECQLIESPGGTVDVQINKRTMSYSKFIGEELGKIVCFSGSNQAETDRRSPICGHQGLSE